MAFFDYISYINNAVNDFVWTKIGIVLLVGAGIFLSIRLNFFQIIRLPLWWKETAGSLRKSKELGDSKAISQFQAMCTALAATLGVGSISGVAAAVCAGGPGAVFWMWVSAIFGMMTSYAENVLGICFRRKNENGEWTGGAMYILRDGLGSKKGFGKIGKILAFLFAVFCLFASVGIGNMGQVNNIIANVESAFRIEKLSSVLLYETADGSVSLYAVILGLLLSIIGGAVILGGIKRIAAAAEKIIPFMVVVFVVGSVIVIAVNYENILPALKSIFTCAFNSKALWGGAAGITVKSAVSVGIKRGVFSNEAGLGSSVMIHAASDVKDPVKQGMWGIFEVFIDTIVVCTMTALVVLTSGVINLENGSFAGTQATLVASSFDTVFAFGDVRFGSMFVSVALFFFAFATLLGWSHYGATAFEYIFGTKHTKIYKIFFVVMIFVGSLVTSSFAWDISDTFNGLMMLPNLVGVLILSPVVKSITDDYIKRRKTKKRKKNTAAMSDCKDS